MPVYRHETYDYGPTFTLADLIAEPARVRASALATQGRIGGEAERFRGELGARSARDIGMIGAQKWNTLGELAGDTLQNIGKYYGDAPKREAEALNLEADRMTVKEAKRQTSMRDAVRMILSAPGLMVQDPQTGVSMYDKQKLSQELTAARLDSSAIADVLKTAEALDGHARDFVTARREAVAALAFEVLQAGSTPISVAGAVATGLRNGAFTERDVQPFLKQIDDQGPDAIFPLMRRLTVGSAYEEQASKILSPADARSQRTKEQLDLMKAEKDLRPAQPDTQLIQTPQGQQFVPKTPGTVFPLPSQTPPAPGDPKPYVRNDQVIYLRPGEEQPGDIPYAKPTSSGGLGAANIQLRNQRTAAALNSIERLKALAPERVEGPLGIAQGLGEVAKGYAGYSTKTRQFQALLQPTAMQMAVAIQGAANLSDTERQVMANMLGSIATMDYTSQMALLDNAGTLLSSNADVEKVGGVWKVRGAPASTPKAPGLREAEPTTAMMKMETPDKRIILVPLDQVEEALRRGAKVVGIQ